MIENPMSARQAAKASGEKTYKGSPCKRCDGSTERRTDNGACTTCHRDNQIRWKAANPDKVNAHARNRRAANLEEYRKRCRDRYDANREQLRAIAREQMRRAREADPEKFRERDRKRYAANPEPKREHARAYAWHEKNPEKARAKYNRYRSRGKTATPSWLKTSGQARLIEEFYANKPAGMEVDHNVPIAGCRVCSAIGLHVLANLQYLTRAENKAKHRRCMACFLKETSDGQETLSHHDPEPDGRGDGSAGKVSRSTRIDQDSAHPSVDTPSHA